VRERRKAAGKLLEFLCGKLLRRASFSIVNCARAPVMWMPAGGMVVCGSLSHYNWRVLHLERQSGSWN